MKIHSVLMTLVVLVAVVALAGCETLIRADENRRACDGSYGGSQQACDALSDRRRGDAATARRNDEEASQKRSSFNAENDWRNEVAWARQEDVAAITARYPTLGRLSGIWCGPFDRRRIEIVGPTQLRVSKKTASYQPGYPTSHSLSQERFHVRARGDLLEFWGGHKLYTPFYTIRMDSQDGFTLVSTSFHKLGTVDKKTPFSGVIERVLPSGFSFKRCTDDPKVY